MRDVSFCLAPQVHNCYSYGWSTRQKSGVTIGSSYVQDESQVAPRTCCEERKHKNAFGEGEGDSFRQPSTMQEGEVVGQCATELNYPFLSSASKSAY